MSLFTTYFSEYNPEAWSQIVQTIIPNIQFITRSLKQVCLGTECDEIILFEKNSFLIISYFERNPDNKSILKYERISTIVKQFKLSCSKIGADIKHMSFQTPIFTAVLEDFTKTTYLLVISLNPEIGNSSNNIIGTAALTLNIGCVKNFFKKNSEELRAILFNEN